MKTTNITTMTIKDMIEDLKDFRMNMTDEEWKEFVQSVKDNEVNK